jgi:hypothetical protein
MAINFSDLGGGGASNSFSISTNDSGRYTLEQELAAGIYTFTGPLTGYNYSFYDSTDTLITSGGTAGTAATVVAVNLPTPATKLLVSAVTTNISIVAEVVPVASARVITATLLTATASVTTTQSARVFAIGGGGGGSVSGGGGSGYLSIGTLAAGTYTCTVGAGGASSGNGSASSIGSITANGGFTASGYNGGAGGSGGGAGRGGANAASFGGINGDSGVASSQGTGGTGSGVKIQGFVISRAYGGAVTVGAGGGTYGGGNGGGDAYSGGNANGGPGGGGGGGSGSGAPGGNGSVLILEGY